MKAIADFIKNGSSFAVMSHISPDGDTMGSAAALVLALRKLGKRAKWFCEGEVPESFLGFPEFAMLVEENNIKTFDSVIAVDCSDKERLGNCRTLFDNTKNKAQIDHHITNTNYADVNLVCRRNANAFIVMRVLEELGVEFDDQIAHALFVGILTDTGRLSHNGITSEDVLQTAQLYNYNIEPDKTTDTLFALHSFEKSKLMGRALNSLSRDGKITYITLLQSDFTECGAATSDTEGIVELARSVTGTEIAFLMREASENMFKFSLRCGPPYDVASVAQRFGGGGHRFAAGCTIEGECEQVLNKMLASLGEILK